MEIKREQERRTEGDRWKRKETVRNETEKMCIRWDCEANMDEKESDCAAWLNDYIKKIAAVSTEVEVEAKAKAKVKPHQNILHTKLSVNI